MNHDYPSVKQLRNDTALVFSLVPGLGHYSKGYVGTAIALLLFTPIVLIMALLLALAKAGVGLMVIPLLYWAGVGIHAYRIPPKHHHTQEAARRSILSTILRH